VRQTQTIWNTGYYGTGYWGTGYWGTGYWGTGYWGTGLGSNAETEGYLDIVNRVLWNRGQCFTLCET